jgi:hypothetical protein
MSAVKGQGEVTFKKADPVLVNSYEFLFVKQSDGHLNLPGSVLQDDDVLKSSVTALAHAKVTSWPMFLEPLYTAYTPRGKLTTVMLANAWMMLPGSVIGPKELLWRPWPVSRHVGPMAGFYKALEDVWKLRLFKHCSEPIATEEISVYMREGAVRHIEQQRAIRANVIGLDTSMDEYLRKSMDDDERKVSKRLLDFEANVQELAAQQAAEAGVSTATETSSSKDSDDEPEVHEGAEEPTDGSSPDGDDNSELDDDDNSEPEDENDWPDDLSFKPGEDVIDAEFSEIAESKSDPKTGFVRPARPLKTER